MFASWALLLVPLGIAAGAATIRREGRKAQFEVGYNGSSFSLTEDLVRTKENLVQKGDCDYTSSSCLAADLKATREKLFQCMETLGYGQSYRDNDAYEEYSECEGQIDGHHMKLSEPQNAISSFAFDSLSCNSASSSELKNSAALLGFGSFIFHAVGGADAMETPQLLDSLGMQCMAANVLFKVMQKTSGPYDVEGYNFNSLNAQCADLVVAAGLKNCQDNQSNAVDLQAVKSILPPYELSFSVLIKGLSIACGGKVPIIKSYASDVIAALYANNPPSYMSDFRFRKFHDFNPAKIHRRRRRRQNMVKDAESAIKFCKRLPNSIADFNAAVQRQGKFPSTKSEQHHTWHEKSASAMNTLVKALGDLRGT